MQTQVFKPRVRQPKFVRKCFLIARTSQRAGEFWKSATCKTLGVLSPKAKTCLGSVCLIGFSSLSSISQRTQSSNVLQGSVCAVCTLRPCKTLIPYSEKSQATMFWHLCVVADSVVHSNRIGCLFHLAGKATKFLSSPKALATCNQRSH